MKTIKLSKICLFSIFLSFLNSSNLLGQDKQFSKERALIEAKKYLAFKSKDLKENETVKLQIIPLAAAASADITTLFYNSSFDNSEGLLLCFFMPFWDRNSGVNYNGYGFKDFNKEDAIEFLKKIETEISANYSFIGKVENENNIYFKYKDVGVLVWSTLSGYSIRIFYKDFDAYWDQTAYERSYRRFVKKVK